MSTKRKSPKRRKAQAKDILLPSDFDDDIDIEQRCYAIWAKLSEQAEDISIMENAFEFPEVETILNGLEAFDALTSMADSLEKECAKIASGNSYHRWLQRIRRMPDQLFGASDFKIPSAYLERVLNAEILASKHAKASAQIMFPMLAITDTMTPADLPNVVRFVYLARSLTSINVLRRCAAKDASIVLKRGDIPRLNENDSIVELIRNFDGRRHQFGIQSFQAGVNGTVFDELDVTDKPGERALSIGLARIPYRQKPTVDYSGLTGVVGANYSYCRIESESHAVFSEYAWYGENLPVLAHVSLALIFSLRKQSYADTMMRRGGYVVMGRDEVSQFFVDSLASGIHDRTLAKFPLSPPITVESIWKALSEPASLSPVRLGPIISNVGPDHVLIDFYALAVEMTMSIRMQGDGGISVARGLDFERATQAMIDTSRWAPDEKTRTLVGKQLKDQSGQKITDIDAIAVRGSMALLINCKSYTADAFGTATPQQARSQITNLGRDVKWWIEKVDQFKRNPVGANYNLSRFDHLVPMLVTPSPCFAGAKLEETEALDGLRLVSSFYELQDYLEPSSSSADERLGY